LERLLKEKDERIRDLKEQLEKKDKVIDSLTETMKLLPQSSVVDKVQKSWWKKVLGKD
jgi:predicted RNase H-like nuclease (RuvC/YqgF family)